MVLGTLAPALEPALPALLLLLLLALLLLALLALALLALLALLLLALLLLALLALLLVVAALGDSGRSVATGSKEVLVTVTGLLAVCKNLVRRRRNAVLSGNLASRARRMQSLS